MRTNATPMLFVVCAVLIGCASPEKLSKTRLAQTMRQNGYSLYTPFRAEDFPGTIFAFARNHEGRTIELTLSPSSQTFQADRNDLFPSEGQAVAIGEKIVQTNAFSGKLAAEILKPLISFSFGLDYVKNFKLEFGPDQRKYVMSLATLEKFRDKFQGDTKAILRRFQDGGQLDHVYLVLETFSVNRMNVEMVAKSGFEGAVSADKIKPLANAKLEAKSGSTKEFVLNFEKPLLIGYKAIKFSDPILSGVVTLPEIKALWLTPSEIDAIKE